MKWQTNAGSNFLRCLRGNHTTCFPCGFGLSFIMAGILKHTLLSPSFTPSNLRIAIGIVICPFEVIFASSIKSSPFQLQHYYMIASSSYVIAPLESVISPNSLLYYTLPQMNCELLVTEVTSFFSETIHVSKYVCLFQISCFICLMPTFWVGLTLALAGRTSVQHTPYCATGFRDFHPDSHGPPRYRKNIDL